MYSLLEFLRKYHYLLLFVVLEAVSFVLLFRFNTYQGSVWFSSANSAVAGVERLYGDAVSYVGLRDVNTRLSDDNVRLQMENEQLREALRLATHEESFTEQNVRDHLKGYTLIPAVVVANTNEGGGHYLVIDRGTNHGVQPEMGVVCGGGVVGIVYLAGPNYSLVIPVTNQKSSISCRIREENCFGYLHWEGGSMLTAYVDDIPRYVRVGKGGTVETSGYSAVFPPGIFVGRIIDVTDSADGLSYRLRVNLGTDFSRIRDVSVIATPYRAEIDTLRAHAVDTTNP